MSYQANSKWINFFSRFPLSYGELETWPIKFKLTFSSR